MTTVKRRKNSDDHHQYLLPGLPDHIAQICLSLVPFTTLAGVCRSWRRLIYSSSFRPSLSLYALLLPTDNLSNSLQFSSFEPISSTWQSLPPPPPLPLLLRHPSYISRYIPIQSVSISGNLVLLAATTPQFHPALPSPLIYNPISNSWQYGPPFLNPRRWCAVGVSNGSVVIASGIGTQYTTEVARSVEKLVSQKYNLTSNIINNNSSCKWEKMGPLKDGKFCREAIDAIGWKNKLLMVNVKGDAAKEGVVYDILTDTWEYMPEGMLSGWKGPAAAMNEEILYVVDESKGVLRKYDEKRDIWEDIMEDERLIGAQNLAAGGGRVCILCGGGIRILVVDMVASVARFWVVDTPVGFQAVAIHILPRMSGPES